MKFLYIHRRDKEKEGKCDFYFSIYVIEVNLSSTSSWVLNTECCSHICNNLQELKRQRKLTKGVELQVANEESVVIIQGGIYYLTLPMGLVIELESCYYRPTINK